MKTFVYATVYLIAFLILLSLYGFYSGIHPMKISRNVTPATFNVKFDKVTMETDDKVTIKGWYIPSSKHNAKTLLLLHGYPADKSDILPSRIFLHPFYNLLFIDFRFLGESSGHHSTFGKEEILDVKAALDYLKSRGIHEVGIYGFSMGGSVAIFSAAKYPQIKAIVVESPYARLDWMADDYYRIPLLHYPLTWLTNLWARILLGYDSSAISPAKAAANVKVPVLLIYSTQDVLIPPRHGDLLQEALRGNSKLEVIKDTKVVHGEPIDDYQAIVKKFFDKSL